MEIKGEDFLKKVQKRQETEELEQRLSQLKQEDEIASNVNINSAKNAYEEEAARVDISNNNELGDIMLNGTPSPSTNETNKKKYLILGLVLIILFLLTIVIIRLLNSPKEENNSFSNEPTAKEEQVLENDNIEKQYQKIIDEKLKNIKEQTQNSQIEEKADEELNIDSIEEKEKKAQQIEESKPDVFGVKEEPEVVEQPKVQEVKKVAEKVVQKPKPVQKPKVVKKAPTKVSSSKPSGTYVQVGAFSRQPAKKYLDKIQSSGFSYTIYKVTVNGKVYNKVLIGPFNSRANAEKNISTIKRKLNISSAFILRF
ncbi:hypothetical protein CRU98_09045 [Arcobacter sp. CECT 8986]|uniref:SPOR domain-containing protein n=1 Tax=Arcobacter sp. CECT 8986 TaxID=2044507 RepID=UPI001009C312|nr:SPOR domain-containing protein [Arcobacter sp. CECT 8986]RXJ98899.1 hypothetical protein CRU98_09045 [Arcobacter sp. CECT 8986]